MRDDKHGLLVPLLTEGLTKDRQDDFDDISRKASIGTGEVFGSHGGRVHLDE
jgi:hypothetical protein